MYLKEKEAIKVTLSALDTAVKQETKELQRIKSEQNIARIELVTLTRSAQLIEQKEALKPAPETLWEEWTREDLIKDSRNSVKEANNFLSFLDEEYQRAEQCVQAIKTNIASKKQALSELHPFTRLRNCVRQAFAAIKRDTPSIEHDQRTSDLGIGLVMLACGMIQFIMLCGIYITSFISAGLTCAMIAATGAGVLAALIALAMYFSLRCNRFRPAHAAAWMASYAIPVWVFTGFVIQDTVNYAKQITCHAGWVQLFAETYFDVLDGNNDGIITQEEADSKYPSTSMASMLSYLRNPDWDSDIATLSKYLPEMGQHNKFVGTKTPNPTIHCGHAIQNSQPESGTIKILYGANIHDVLSFERRMHEKYDKWLP